MVVFLLFVALCSGTISFLTLLSFQGLVVAIVGSAFASSGMMVLAGAALASRGATSAAFGDEEQTEVVVEGHQRASRVPKFMRGRLKWDDCGSGADCIVHDLSETGARLGLPNGVVVPEVIELHLSEQSRTVQAQVRWRSADQVGVEFLHQSPIEGVDDATLRSQIAQLRAEVVRLQTVLEERWSNPQQSSK